MEEYPESSPYTDYLDFASSTLAHCSFYIVERVEHDFFLLKLFMESGMFVGYAENDRDDYMLPDNWEAAC